MINSFAIVSLVKEEHSFISKKGIYISKLDSHVALKSSKQEPAKYKICFTPFFIDEIRLFGFYNLGTEALIRRYSVKMVLLKISKNV